MSKYKIIISAEDINQLMSANFLSESYKEVIFDIITIKDINVNIANFDKYTNEYIEAFIYYQFLKNNIANSYIPYDIRINHNDIDWDIDFGSMIMTVTFLSGCNNNDDQIMRSNGWRTVS